MAVKMEMLVSTGMHVCMHVPTPARISPDHDRAEQDEQRRHEELSRRPQARRQLESQYQDYAYDHANGGGMADAPHESETRGAPKPGAGARRQRRHGGQMVGLERVTKAEQQANPANGK